MFSLKTEEVRWFVDIQLNLTQKVTVFSHTAGPGSSLLRPHKLFFYLFIFNHS